MTLQDSSGASGLDAGSRVVALVVALFVVDVGWNLSLNTLLDRSGVAATAGVAYDVTLPLTTLGAVGGLLAATVGGVVLIAALVRAFAPESDALGGDETPVETLVVYARAVVVAVAGTVAVGVGLAALVVPGVVVLVHLPLVFVAVATDGDSIGRAVDRTWVRVRGHRARVVAVSLAVVAVPLSLATVATLTALLPATVELVLGALVTTAAVAAGAAAFVAIAASIDGTSAGAAATDRVNPATSRQL
jgi:hypothetical protein